MQLAYFINQYPKVSHSFIRREIQALEDLGFDVKRYALRCNPEELVDPIDLKELEKTRHILSQPILKILWDCSVVLMSHPKRFLSAMKMAVKMGFRSDRGVCRHLIYLFESCVLLRWQKQSGIQHIHAHFGTNSTTVVMLTQILGGAGFSFTVHGPEEFDRPEFISLADKIRHCSFVVAISSYGRSQLYRWIEADEWDKVKVVHCGLEHSFFEQKATTKAGLSLQLICVGRLCEQKGQLLLIEAMKRLRDSNIKCKLILAGDGPMRSIVDNRIAEFQLNDLIEVTGWVSSETVKEILLASRGLVLPSFAEGLPVVIMESLALQRPVISTYVAGIPELVKPGENGWLVPAGDVDALTNAMRMMVGADEKQLEAMGKSGYIAAKERHDIQKEAKKLADLFTGAIS